MKDRVTLFFEDADAKLTLELPKGQPSVLELWRESDDALVTMLYSGETVDETFINPGDGVYHPINPAVFLMSEGKGYVFEVKSTGSGRGASGAGAADRGGGKTPRRIEAPREP